MCLAKMEMVYELMRLMKINNKIYKYCNPYKTRNIRRKSRAENVVKYNSSVSISYLCMGKPIISKLSTNWS